MRHASAGDRDDWDGDDRLRPLDGKGRRQAAALAGLLAGRGARSAHSSPYARCVQTVEPLAARLGAPVVPEEDLAEGGGLRALDLARRAGEGAVLCTHGDVVGEVVDLLVRQRVVASPPEARKASTWILTFDGDRVTAAEHLRPPA